MSAQLYPPTDTYGRCATCVKRLLKCLSNTGLDLAHMGYLKDIVQYHLPPCLVLHEKQLFLIDNYDRSYFRSFQVKIKSSQK